MPMHGGIRSRGLRPLVRAIAAGIACFALVSVVGPLGASAGVGQTDMDTLVAAARQEGVVVMYGPRGLAELPNILKARFEAEYGIRVEYLNEDGPPAWLDRVPRERAAGQYNWDVLFGGADTLMFNAKAAGLIDHITPALVDPTVADPRYWQGGRIPYIDTEDYVLPVLAAAGQSFWVNTAKASPSDITSYHDLLDPRWRGQIVFANDPRTSGSGRTTLTFLYGLPGFGADFIRQFVQQQELRIGSNDDEVAAMLSAHDFALCVCNRASIELLGNQGVTMAGLDSHRIREGGSLNSSFANFSMMNHPAHPNAAKLYANWVLSQRVGQALVSLTEIPSMRADVDNSRLPLENLPEPGWVFTNTEASLTQSREVVDLITPLLR
jgi:ABC-type Fe3+ transport system substrate-binding protein